MFSNYKDKIWYKERKIDGQTDEEYDQWGNIKTMPAEQRNVRYIGWEEKIEHTDNSVKRIIEHKYHCPFEIYDGDEIGVSIRGKIEYRKVNRLKYNKGVTGRQHYWICWVV